MLCDDTVITCTFCPNFSAPGVEMPPFRQTFEWRPVGAAAIRKRKRKSDNFQLQIQGNRCLDEAMHCLRFNKGLILFAFLFDFYLNSFASHSLFTRDVRFLMLDFVVPLSACFLKDIELCT